MFYPVMTQLPSICALRTKGTKRFSVSKPSLASAILPRRVGRVSLSVKAHSRAKSLPSSVRSCPVVLPLPCRAESALRMMSSSTLRSESAWGTRMVRQLIQTLQSDAFRARIEAMGGYTLDRPGELIDVF